MPGSAAADRTADRTLCTIRDSRITESSGLAAAGDSLYTVNDGGTRLRVFVLDRSCRVRRTIQAALDPYDVEDLARAADGTFWLADTGDNALSRSTVALERLRPDGTATLFRLTYPDGPHDAEALLLDRSGRPFIVTKEPLSSGVYTPVDALSAGGPTALRKVPHALLRSHRHRRWTGRGRRPRSSSPEARSPPTAGWWRSAPTPTPTSGRSGR